MESTHVIDLLPWHLNGSLAPEEERRVMDHLASCDGCRRELDETREAFRIYGQHLPAEVLVDLAFERPPKLPRALVDEHLRRCSECRDELALVLESRQSLQEPEERAALPGVPSDVAGGATVLPMPARTGRPPVSALWRGVALAASVVGLLSAGGWLWSSRLVGAGNERVAELERRIGDLERSGSERRGLEAPELNVSVVDLFPDGMVVRGGETEDEPAVPIPSGVRWTTLVLNSELPADEPPLRVRLLDARGEEIWSLEGLRRNPTGEYTVSFPSAELEPGEYELELRGERAGDEVALESYRIRIG